MKCEVQFRTKVGWYLLWDNGWTSSMPDEETAHVQASAPELLKALERLLTSAEAIHSFRLGHHVPPLTATAFCDAQSHAHAAIAKAKRSTP